MGEDGKVGEEDSCSASGRLGKTSDDKGSDGDEEGLLSSLGFLLLFLLQPPFSFPSPFIMKFVNRFTSASFTGFTINSSAPSSKHLLNNLIK